MPAIGFFTSAEAMRALDRHHRWLQEKCLSEQREAAGSSERMAIGEAFEPELDACARVLDFLRRVPDAEPKVYTPRGALGREDLIDDDADAAERAAEKQRDEDASERAKLAKLDAIKNGDFE